MLRLVWSGTVPAGGLLQVSQDERGVWHVVYGGFSRSSSSSLRAALAEASGSHTDTEWLDQVEGEIAALRVPAP